MRLTPVDTESSPVVDIKCCVCGKWTLSNRAFADLDGEPFKAYYCEACKPYTRFVITHLNANGVRTLTFANQGRNHYATDNDAFTAMITFEENGSLKNVIGQAGFESLAVREVECWPSGDAKGIYFDK